jgi:membrane-bound lytic murein transglycosylase D
MDSADMHATLRLAALLGLIGLALAGCATTGNSDYSSLPPAPQHPSGNRAPPKPAPTMVQSHPWMKPVPQLPADQYTDLMDRMRAGFALPDVSHYAIEREAQGFAAKPDYLSRTFTRGRRYLHHIVGEIDKRGMPMELALLPVVESAFNPVAYSRSRAAGLWQFIPSSGKHWGLEQNWWVDERRDVLKATDAALTYLQYLHDYFNGDWLLAIAAYNGGEGTVSAAVRRNAAAGLPTDFFSLNLRAETRAYVPKLLAISRIVGNPESYGLEFSQIPNAPFFEIVDAGRQVNINDAADLAGISRDDMFALNPSFNRLSTPPGGPHRLLLPVGKGATFQQALLNSTPAPTQSFATTTPVESRAPLRHEVQRGETLMQLSRRYDVPVDSIRRANGMVDSNIHPGDVLVIPASTGLSVAANDPAQDDADSEAQPPARQAPPPPRKSAPAKSRTHVVKPGETLWSVARRYDVTVPALAAANDLSTRAGIDAGQRLEIPGKSTGSKSGSRRESSTVTYRVRRGDTLGEIADKFNVSVRDLRAWNKLSPSSPLQQGQKLVLHVDASRQNGG